MCVLSPPHGGLLNSLKSRELPFTRMALNISWLALQKIPQTCGSKNKTKQRPCSTFLGKRGCKKGIGQGARCHGIKGSKTNFDLGVDGFRRRTQGNGRTKQSPIYTPGGEKRPGGSLAKKPKQQQQQKIQERRKGCLV